MNRTVVTTKDVAAFYAERAFDLADAYACLLISSGHAIWQTVDLLRDAAARVVSGALNALHATLHLAARPLDLFDRLADPVAFAWACLRQHVARLAAN